MAKTLNGATVMLTRGMLKGAVGTITNSLSDRETTTRMYYVKFKEGTRVPRGLGGFALEGTWMYRSAFKRVDVDASETV